MPTDTPVLATLVVGDRTFRVCRATRDDVPGIVALLRDDVLGSGREGAPESRYLAAFEAVDAEPAHTLVVVREQGAGAGPPTLLATLQLTLLPGLSRGGATRLQVEGVRVADAARGSGLGTALLEWVAAYGRERGAVLAQLTTDRARTEARRFYERLGWVASHDGMKLTL